jgi:hypothetical protein
MAVEDRVRMAELYVELRTLYPRAHLPRRLQLDVNDGKRVAVPPLRLVALEAQCVDGRVA